MKTIIQKIKINLKNYIGFEILLKTGIFLLILSVLFISYSKNFSIDEIEGIHTAWKMFNGEKIYLDFFQHHHSLFYYLLMPLNVIFDESAKTLIVARMYFFIIILSIVFLTYKIASLENNKIQALISVTLLLSFVQFSYHVVDIKPDIPQIALILCSVYNLLVYFKNNSTKNLITSAITLGLAFLILQKTVFIIAIFGLIQLYYIFKRDFFWKYFLLYWGIFILSILPYYIYLFLTDQFSIYFTFNWLINLKGQYQFSPIQNLKNSYHQHTLHWLFYFVTIFFIQKDKYLNILSITSILLILALFFVNAPYPQYYIIITPFVSILSAKGIYSLFKNKTRILYFIILLSIIPFYFELIKTKSNSETIERLQFVLDNTNKNDKVFDGLSYINLYRNDIDYFWFSVYESGLLDVYQQMTGYHYDVYELIEKQKPKIIFSHTIKNMNHEYIKPYYYQSEKYPRIYLRQTNNNETDSESK